MFKPMEIPPENQLVSIPPDMALKAGIPKYVSRPGIVNTAFRVLDTADNLAKAAEVDSRGNIDAAKQAEFMAADASILKDLVRQLVSKADETDQLGIQDEAGVTLVAEVEDFLRFIP